MPSHASPHGHGCEHSAHRRALAMSLQSNSIETFNCIRLVLGYFYVSSGSVISVSASLCGCQWTSVSMPHLLYTSIARTWC